MFFFIMPIANCAIACRKTRPITQQQPNQSFPLCAFLVPRNNHTTTTYTKCHHIAKTTKSVLGRLDPGQFSPTYVWIFLLICLLFVWSICYNDMNALVQKYLEFPLLGCFAMAPGPRAVSQPNLGDLSI